MPERLIRKYTNRRLYDPEESPHVTLEDLRRMIVAGETVRVVDDKTGDDLTRSILLQIVTEQEGLGTPILTVPLLTQLIRLYGNPLQAAMARYLERSVQQFESQGRTMLEQMNRLAGDADVADLARRNVETWVSMQESFLNMLTSMSGQGRNGARRGDRDSDRDRDGD